MATLQDWTYQVSLKHLLRRVAAFSHLDDAHLETLTHCLHRRRVPAGAVIFSEGDPGEAAYFVIRGQVRIVKTTPDGTEQVLHLCRAGDAFGAVVLFDEGTYPATAVAGTTCELACLNRQAFQQVVREVPDLSRALGRELGGRLRRAHQRLLSLTAHDAPGRLAELLLQLAGFDSGGTPAAGAPVPHPQEAEKPLRITLPTHQELATYIGTARETVSRTLGRWRRMDLVRDEGDVLVIPSPRRLRREAGLDP